MKDTLSLWGCIVADLYELFFFFFRRIEAFIYTTSWQHATYIAAVEQKMQQFKRWISSHLIVSSMNENYESQPRSSNHYLRGTKQLIAQAYYHAVRVLLCTK